MQAKDVYAPSLAFLGPHVCAECGSNCQPIVDAFYHVPSMGLRSARLKGASHFAPDAMGCGDEIKVHEEEM